MIIFITFQSHPGAPKFSIPIPIPANQVLTSREVTNLSYYLKYLFKKMFLICTWIGTFKRKLINSC